MASILSDRRVALIKETAAYSAVPPYDPSETYPEFPAMRVSASDNPAFRAVRLAFEAMGYDAARRGTREWSPLSDFIRPGQKVVLKPNLVMHRNLGDRVFGLTDTDSLLTHGSIIRAVLDYAALALRGSGRIIIGDCPLQGTNWEGVLALTNLPAIVEYAKRAYPGVDLVLRDYRIAVAETKGASVSKRVVREVSPADYVEVDLGKRSLLLPLMRPGVEFGVSQYGRKRMRAAHNPDTNKYLLARDFLTTDVLINLPKLKTHQKAGVTVALKNLVGLNGHKDYLPHFRLGSPKSGGDEYPDGNLLWDALWAAFHRDWELEAGWQKSFWGKLAGWLELAYTAQPSKRNDIWLGGGSWHGNDTIWRTVLDINRAFFYFDKTTGSISSQPRQDLRYLAIADGLIAGQGEGPLAPSPMRSGLLLCAANPAAMDTVAAACMGLDVGKLAQIREAYRIGDLPLVEGTPDELEILGNTGRGLIADVYRRPVSAPFRTSLGYRGCVEFSGAAESAIQGVDTDRAGPHKREAAATAANVAHDWKSGEPGDRFC